MTLEAGDRVRTRRDAEHVFDSFRGVEAEVLEVANLGGRRWAQLRFANERVTWLPATRLERLESK